MIQFLKVNLPKNWFSWKGAVKARKDVHKKKLQKFKADVATFHFEPKRETESKNVIWKLKIDKNRRDQSKHFEIDKIRHRLMIYGRINMPRRCKKKVFLGPKSYLYSK